MKRRHRYLLLSLLLLSLIGVGAFLLIWQTDSADPIRYDRFGEIHPGMTKVEVHAALGCSPANYARRCVHYRRVLNNGSIELCQMPADCQFMISKNTEHWAGNHGRISVSFDANGIVRDTEVWQSRSRWLLIIEDRLGLLR